MQACGAGRPGGDPRGLPRRNQGGGWKRAGGRSGKSNHPAGGRDAGSGPLQGRHCPRLTHDEGAYQQAKEEVKRNDHRGRDLAARQQAVSGRPQDLAKDQWYPVCFEKAKNPDTIYRAIIDSQPGQAFSL